MLEELEKKYQMMQKKYGDSSLDAITFGGCKQNPNICFVFMNPTGKNIASSREWKGIKSPWIGTKNIWKLFYKLQLLEENIYLDIAHKKSNEWTEKFAEEVYHDLENHKVYITNLAKCTQLDARPLKDEIYKKYLDCFYEEMNIVKPKVIVLFGNQVSSIILKQKISVSKVRGKAFSQGNFTYYAVYYPVGNAIFNMDKSIVDIKSIMQEKSML